MASYCQPDGVVTYSLLDWNRPWTRKGSKGAESIGATRCSKQVRQDLLSALNSDYI